MPRIGAYEQIRVRGGEALVDIARTHAVRPDQITRADGTQAPPVGLIPGETLLIHNSKDPNRTQAILALLASALAAKNMAADAQRQVTSVRRAMEAANAREKALQNAAADFNGTIKRIRILLSQAEGDHATLVLREKSVADIKDLLDAAQIGLANLDPAAHEPAFDVLNGLNGRHAKVASRAASERAKFTEWDTTVDADYKAMTELIANHANKEGKLVALFRALHAKYETPNSLIGGLPPDAQRVLGDKITKLNSEMHSTIVRYSGESWLDQRDNSYMFGRPGPKMIKNAKAIQDYLVSDDPLTAGLRTKILEHLSNMDEAVRTFEDPTVRAAAKSVYEDLAGKAFSKMAGRPTSSGH